jgi:PAS domain S-box-containing protein
MMDEEKTREQLILELEELRRRLSEAGSPNDKKRLDANNCGHRVSESGRAESEANLRSLFESNLDAVFLTAPYGSVMAANPAACAMFGMSEEEICRVGRQGLIDPSDSRHAAALDERARAGKLQSELRFVRKDGSKFLAEVSFVMLEGEKRSFVILRDITERKLAEDALRESERKYRSFFENSFDAIFLTVAEDGGEILAASPEACRMFGYTEEEFCKLGRGGIVDTTDPQCRRFLQERALRGKARSGMVHIRKEGTKFPTDVSSTIFKDKDGRNLCITIVRDISEHKRDELALRKSEEHYRSLFENMLEGFAYCKMIFENERPVDFEYLAVNSAFEELTGLNNVIGKKVTEVIPGVRESSPELFEIYSRVALTGRPERFETYMPGLGIWFIISVYSHEKGSFVAIFDNVSDRKKAEAALRFANEELEKRVEERTSELKTKTINLEEVNTALRVLLDRREEDRKGFEQAIAGNLKGLILPYIEKLQRTQLSANQATYISILQSHLQEIESRFIKNLSLQHMGLTPTEMQVAGLIRDGRTSKDIAEVLHVSEKAVEFHRNNLRRKLNIANKKENLRSHLLALA